ncbi:hypothetical protein BBH88_03335 [Planococcus antarcticus DSM 14505]|uniref:DUF4398 domain-containing protein n=1 Tax=Planococcus antarcticus DSM 14505 TaxID=1185653 RepID=A0ABM6D236_9BACL|nr:hypothetical protein [Planococcus antarcticus]ANU09409.1 hypothetical protein BBH88_03335 [Planococcus antarcticus DSM 14505]
MRKLFISSLVIFIVLAGCSNDEAYNNAVHKGLDYIASEEYQKAESAFELAIDEKSNDKKATALLDQTVYHQEAIKAMEEGDLDSATEKAEKVINTEDGSSALVKKSKDIVASIEDLETTLAELTEEYEAALKQFENKEYTEANKTVDNLLKHESEQPIFESIKKDVRKLQEDIKLALDSEKKAEEETEKAAEEAESSETTSEQEVGLIDMPIQIGENLSDLTSYYGDPTYDDYFMGGRLVVFEEEDGYFLSDSETVTGYMISNPYISIYETYIGMTFAEVTSVFSEPAESFFDGTEMQSYANLYYIDNYKIIFYSETESGPTTSAIIIDNN